MGEELVEIGQCAGGLLGPAGRAREHSVRGAKHTGQKTPRTAGAVTTGSPPHLLDNLTIAHLPRGVTLLTETHESTTCSELGNRRVSTSPDNSRQALVLLPGRYPSTNQRAHLDLPEADGDGGGGGETFDDGAGDEIQQEPWPAKREH